MCGCIGWYRAQFPSTLGWVKTWTAADDCGHSPWSDHLCHPLDNSVVIPKDLRVAHVVPGFDKLNYFFASSMDCICSKFLLIKLFSFLLRNEPVLWVGSDTRHWPKDQPQGLPTGLVEKALVWIHWCGVMWGVWGLLMDLGREDTHPTMWPELSPAVSWVWHISSEIWNNGGSCETPGISAGHLRGVYANSRGSVAMADVRTERHCQSGRAGGTADSVNPRVPSETCPSRTQSSGDVCTLVLVLGILESSLIITQWDFFMIRTLLEYLQ